MNFSIARNITASSTRDAFRLFLPTRRLVSQRRVRALEAARSHDERDHSLRRWSREALDALEMTIDVEGLENVGSGPYIVVSLHEGLMDVPVLIDALALPLTFVARAALDADLPTPGLLAASGQILINPEAPSSLRAMLRGAAQVTAQGRSVATFPQGSVLGIEAAFQPGPFAVSRHLDLPVLPVAIWGTAPAWEHPFAPRVRRGVRASVRVLEPRQVPSEAEYRRVERELKATALSDSSVTPRRFVPERDGFWDGFNFEIDPDFPTVAAEVAKHRGSLISG